MGLTSILIVSLLIFNVAASINSYVACNSTAYLQSKTLTCKQCPINTIPNPNQIIPNQCVCQSGYYSTSNNACARYSAGGCTSDKFVDAFYNNGSVTGTASSCESCSTSTGFYANQNGTACISCGIGTKYQNQQCKCIDPSQTYTLLGCFPESIVTGLGLTLTSSQYYNQLKYLVPGCHYFKDQLSCSHILNLCTYSQLDFTTPECQFFQKSALTSYLYSSSTKYKAQSTLFSKTSNINMKIIYFLPEGNYVKEKNFQFGDVMRCGLPHKTDMEFALGSNIAVTCDFNFNNLAQQIESNTYQNYVYQLFIESASGSFSQVEVYINSNPQPVKRFFLQDSYSSTLNIKVLTSLIFQLTLNSNDQFVTPSLYVGYTSLPLVVGSGINPTSQRIQSISYEFKFSSDLTSFWTVIISIFIVVSVLALVHTAAKTYVGYLNRKTPLLFFFNFLGIWSLWIFYFLLGTSGYWFLFTKATPSIYTFISSDSQLYVAFYAVVAIMIVFHIMHSIINKIDKLNIQIFMINWQKNDKHKNSWRQIFIVNSLAQFFTYRTFSTFWFFVVFLFFMTGLNWQAHDKQTISTSNIGDYFTPSNRILLYFLSSSILIVIGIIFKILRRALVITWPYPFEDFVDYCTVTNLSFFFIKKRSSEAYYIHAAIPIHTQVTYKQINEAVKRGLQKNRSVANQISQQGNLKLYAVYISHELQAKFNTMLKKQQDQQHSKRMKYATNSSVHIKPQKSFTYRQEFIQKKLKPQLQQLGQQFGGAHTKSAFQSFFGIPPVNLRDQGALRNRHDIFFDDKADLVRDVFPNGDEFQDIHLLIMMFLGWAMITGSCPIAAFLTYFCDQYLINQWISSSSKQNLQKMTRVKQGFMV